MSVLVPAYQAESFICRTLDSLADQSHRNLELLVSIDKSDDNTGSVVEAWCEKHSHLRSRIYHQESRLGWIGNINFLIGKCDNRYFMVLPHDDLLHEDYVAKMVEALQQNNKASVAYSDIRCDGELSRSLAQESITGNRHERILEFLDDHFRAVAFRGVVNKAAMADLVCLPEGDQRGFGIDATWNLQMAVRGETVRVPEVLYTKQFRKNSAHTGWLRPTREEQIADWLQHCRDCLEVIDRAGFSPEERAGLYEAVQARLVQSRSKLWNYRVISGLSSNEQQELLSRLEVG